MKTKSMFIFFLPILLMGSCQESSPDDHLNEIERTLIINEIETAVWTFHAADTSRNADAIINLLWPECTMLIDGNRVGYQDLSQGANEFMKTLTLFHTEWNDLQILPISNNAAIASFIFKDSIINNQGTLTMSQGPNTFLWQKRNNEWRILYGDADHYPWK